VIATGTAVLHIGHEFGALNLGFVMKSESEETYFALSVIVA
jgi:tryptophanyl-tRNA synthetase